MSSLFMSQNNQVYNYILSKEKYKTFLKTLIFLDISKSLIIAELGTNRDPQKMECVVKNITSLMNKVHG